MKRKIWLSTFAIIVGMFLLGNNCDYGIKPDAQSLVGEVIFNGEWPESATMAFIVVTHEKPSELILDQNLLKGYYQIPDYDLLARPDTIHFEIEMNSGIYNWVFIAVLDDAAVDFAPDNPNPLGWRNLAGEYRDPENPSRLGSVEIGEGIPQQHIRIMASFDPPYQGVGNPGSFRLVDTQEGGR
ncbi:MAG TPA: hypothetical protein ENN07_08175 [candidate division Zixibacteria bacterium]|nr:hypothetical protein [candidate division Zixibacteria bacterium]